MGKSYSAPVWLVKGLSGLIKKIYQKSLLPVSRYEAAKHFMSASGKKTILRDRADHARHC